MYPDVEIHTKDVVDWVNSKYLERTGKIFRDPDWGIRSLYQKGFLQKIAKGVYKYDPKYAQNKHQADFSSAQKNEILKRDGYKCVVCGLGRENGLDLHIDHIKPRSFGGQGTIENGQVLCAPHNFIKKNLNQTETGKKGFIRLLELVRSTPNDPAASQLENFLLEVLGVYDKHGVDGHILWDGSPEPKGSNN